MSASGSPRRARVAQTMRDLLSQMIDRELKDPRVKAAGLINVNSVELNRDMSVARIYVSFIIEDDKVIERAMKGLEASVGFIRGPLTRAINLSRAPELRFVRDHSPVFKNRLSEIVAEDEEKAREAGRDLDAEAEEPSD